MKSLRLAAVLGALLLSGCSGGGEKGESTNKAAASEKPKSSATTSSGGGAQAKPEPPKDVDSKVVDALKKVTSCERKDGRLGECPAADEFRTLVREYEQDAKKRASSCLSMIADANSTIRELAAECAGAGGAEDDSNAMNLVLTQLEAESGEDARVLLANTVNAIGLSKTGAADRVIALLQKHKSEEGWAGVTRNLLDALTNVTPEPPAAAWDIAIELLKAPKGGSIKESAADLVARVPSKSADGCKALLGLVETGSYPWGSGMDAMGRLGCKAESGALVTAVIKKMAEEDGYDKGFKGADFIYLQRYLEKVQLSKEDKDKLKKATDELSKKTKSDTVKQDCKKLTEKLG
ncbi:MAG: hypothetical protein U0271_24350 [Polyangiaceae bacterium]